MAKSLVLEKAVAFALRIVKLSKYLAEEKREYVLSKQVLLSGTFIAQFVTSATRSEDRSGFISQMHIALQRASETEFWLLILREGEYIGEIEYQSVNSDCVELIKMLTSIVKTSKNTNE